MSRIKGKNTTPEIRLRQALWRAGLRYRLHMKIEGIRPDLVFPARRLALFIDGCFWHGCPDHYVSPRTRSEFWSAKLAANTERDRIQTLRLLQAGWQVLRLWEHEVDSDIKRATDEVIAAYRSTESAFNDRNIVVNVEPASPDGSLEQWRIRNLIGNGECSLQLRPRKPLRKPT